MISWVEPMFSGDLLVSSIGAAFLLTLTLLSVSTLLGNGWGPRRMIAATAAAYRRRQAAGAQRAANLAAIRRRPALAQLNMRIKTAGVIAHTSAQLPRPRTRQAVPAFDRGRDGRFSGRLEDLAGLYLSPPEHALVWCCDESRQLQAVNRTVSPKDSEAQPVLRHGLPVSTPLSDALCDLSSSVIGSCDRRERHVEWLNFLRQVDRDTPPGKQLRVMCDNRASQDHPAVRKWLAAHPHVHMQFTASASSGLKMVKRFFDNVIAEQLGVRAFHSIAALTAAIARHVAVRLTDAVPFIWVRQPQGIPASGHGRKMTARVLEARG